MTVKSERNNGKQDGKASENTERNTPGRVNALRVGNHYCQAATAPLFYRFFFGVYLPTCLPVAGGESEIIRTRRRDAAAAALRVEIRATMFSTVAARSAACHL